MSNYKCDRCDGRLIEIDHWGERPTGCPGDHRRQNLYLQGRL